VSARPDPALVIANENNAGELALSMLLVGSYRRQRTIRSATTVFANRSAMLKIESFGSIDEV